jgi:tetratricopeptide (TPR) repeat protein
MNESAPDEAKFRFNYGLALFLNKNYKEAAEQFRAILPANPQDGEAYFALAKMQELLGDEKAADTDNNARRFLTANNRYAKLQDEWLKTKTIEAVALRVEQPSRRDFVSVVLTKKQTDAPVQTAQSDAQKLLAEAQSFYTAGRDDDAMNVLRRILASEPMSAESYLMLGLIHLRRGDLDQSVSSLKTALFWNNRLTDAHIALGKIYVQKGDCLQAQNYARLALETAPESEEVLGLQRQVERCSK